MTEERLQRRLAAILAADAVGYSRLMGVDEAGTLARLKAMLRSLKNIARPVRIYRVDFGDESAARPVASTLPLSDTPSIAVLPFQNMSGDPEQDYFCDGLVEDIITTLSKLPRLRVIARNSSFV